MRRVEFSWAGLGTSQLNSSHGVCVFLLTFNSSPLHLLFAPQIRGHHVHTALDGKRRVFYPHNAPPPNPHRPPCLLWISLGLQLLAQRRPAHLTPDRDFPSTLCSPTHTHTFPFLCGPAATHKRNIPHSLLLSLSRSFSLISPHHTNTNTSRKVTPSPGHMPTSPSYLRPVGEWPNS